MNRKCSRKSALALKPDGRLALFWNMYTDESSAVHKEYLTVCTEYGLVPFQDGAEMAAKK
ncbi:hypothetical protein [Paenibacillus rhizophilus]|uniref:Uncharacterized protein n=1 Tax=Paenibacillus rhizophilus TaxID=1850366 RepID=A0A3N9P278_9BACL|nr:hypothetical protein [Paenibacillus rhizophilus]RQW10321.1 hypothetical protein EH198_15965 [Paenibacillus rhizophilus]